MEGSAAFGTQRWHFLRNAEIPVAAREVLLRPPSLLHAPTFSGR